MPLDSSDWGLTSADDTFHERDDNPWWTETVWFAFMVPERNMLGYFYPVFRENLGIQAGGVLLFDGCGELPWELPVFDYAWHNRIPPDCDLRDARFGGMSLKCIVPNQVFEFGYEGRDVALQLRFEAVMKPMVTRAQPPFNKGHIDQIGHVTGTITLDGGVIQVDCFAMRDRSWGPRQDGRQPQVGYSYATQDADNGWLAVSLGKNDAFDVTMGFLMRDGVWSTLVGGSRSVERDARGAPVRYRVEAVDALGRSLSVIGRARSRQVFTPYPSMFCWNALVAWSGDDFAGYGEDQDCWSPRKWQRYLRERDLLPSLLAGATADDDPLHRGMSGEGN